jgi:LAS superfamily LD-carboxypeptidase LdcB
VIIGGSTGQAPLLRLQQFVCLVCLVCGWVVLGHLTVMQVAAHTSIAPAQSGFPPIALFRSTLNTLAPVSALNRAVAAPLKFGHLAYAEADRRKLLVVGSYSQDGEQRFERLDRVAALALMKMLDAARLDGIWLVPVSGFRDIERQDMLFQSQTAQQGSAAAAARAVAPPGHSEHHTGYAIDLANGLAPKLAINLAFGESEAFQWLDRRAREFGFELSFPRDNPQGVNYEPWHWRFVGSVEAQKTFAQARSHFGTAVD